MPSATVHVYGWDNQPICFESVNPASDDAKPSFCLGSQDCALVPSTACSLDESSVTLYRKYSGECGLLESCLGTVKYLSLIKVSSSKNIVVYVDSKNFIWSYDSMTSPITSINQSLPQENASIFSKPTSSVNVNEETNTHHETNEQELLRNLNETRESAYSRFRHNLISSKITVLQVAAGDSHCLILTSSHELFSYGSCTCGELGIGIKTSSCDKLQRVSFTGNDKVKYIAAGSYYSAAISTTGSLYTFGCGAYYRLGHGSDENSLFPQKVEALEGVGMLLRNGTSTGVALVACGVWHTVAVAQHTHDVFAWGWNTHGQCGAGVDHLCGVTSHTTDHTTTPPVNSTSSSSFIPVPVPGSGPSRGVSEALSEPRRLCELDREDLVGDDDISAVSCGSRHTAVLTRNSTRIIVIGVLGCTTDFAVPDPPAPAPPSASSSFTSTSISSSSTSSASSSSSTSSASSSSISSASSQSAFSSSSRVDENVRSSRTYRTVTGAVRYAHARLLYESGVSFENTAQNTGNDQSNIVDNNNAEPSRIRIINSSSCGDVQSQPGTEDNQRFKKRKSDFPDAPNATGNDNKRKKKILSITSVVWGLGFVEINS